MKKICIFPILFLAFSLRGVNAGSIDEERIALLPASQKPTASETLRPNTLYIKRLKGGERHQFSLELKEGECARLVVDQKGIDVTITVTDQRGTPVKEIDRPSGSYGRETVTILKQKAGIFSVEVSSWLTTAVSGNYEISYTTAAAPTEADVGRARAEDLTSEAERLRNGGSRENKELSLKMFFDALESWERLEDKYEQAIVLYGIGFVNYSLSNYYQAAGFYHRALNIHLQIGDELGQAVNFTGLGSVQYVLNETEFAIYNYRKAIGIYLKMQNARGLGIVFHGLGTAQLLAGNFPAAMASLTESLRWRTRANDTGGTGRTHITLGKLYLLQRSFRNAKLQFDKAGNSLRLAGIEQDAELLYFRGRYYEEIARPNDACSLLEEAIDLSVKTGNKLGEANGLLELSKANRKLAGTDKALEDIERAVRLISEHRQSIRDFRTRTNFTETVQAFYEEYIAVLMALNEREPDKGFDQKAFEISEQARARGLLDQLELRSLIRRKMVNPKLLERQQLIRDGLTDLLAAQNDSRGNLTAEIQNYSSQLAEVEAAISELFDKPEVVSPPPLGVAEIQENLDENTVLLEYWLNKNEPSSLWLVSKYSVTSYKLPPGDNLERSARIVYACTSDPVQWEASMACREKDKKLSSDLLASVADHLRGKRLIVVKHKYLHYIPFGALINPTDSRFLLETNEVLTIPSASLFEYVRNTKTEQLPKRTLLIFADPVYSAGDERIESHGSRKVRPGGALPRLFASRFEADRISSLLEKDDITIKTDFDASRDAFLRADISNYRILHFATHSNTNDQRPELSSIVLSAYDKQGREIPSYLRQNDIMRFDLGSDLVVLSACQTGIGKQVGGEGIVSLGQTFFSAGAKRVVVSLWKVDSKVTAELMTDFYKRYLTEHKSVSVALREAQIAIHNDSRWKSPYFWAVFSVEGDW